MASGDESRTVNILEIGLDRAAIDANGQIQLPESQSPSSGPDDSLRDAGMQAENESAPSSLAHVLSSDGERSHDALAKLKITLNPSKGSAALGSEAPVLADSSDGQSGSRLVHELPAPEKPTFKDFLHHPIKTTKSKISKQGNHQVAAQIAAKEVPHGQEVDLVNADTAVEHATTADEKQSAVQELSGLMEARQKTYVRWTLDRHVTKVRALPRDTFARKPRKDFETKDAGGNVVVDWEAYSQHVRIVASSNATGKTLLIRGQPAAALFCPKVRRAVHWLWFRSATCFQGDHHAQH